MRPAVSVLVVAMLFSVPAIAADHPASSFAGVWATEDGGRVNVNVAAHRIVSTYPDGQQEVAPNESCAPGSGSVWRRNRAAVELAPYGEDGVEVGATAATWLRGMGG